MKSLYTKTRLGNHGTVHEILGFHLIFGWAGNCITPVLQFQRGRITARINLRNEVNVYYGTRKDGSRFLSWNWDWLARQLGQETEAPHGTVWIYKGILGNHFDI